MPVFGVSGIICECVNDDNVIWFECKVLDFVACLRKSECCLGIDVIVCYVVADVVVVVVVVSDCIEDAKITKLAVRSGQVRLLGYQRIVVR